MQGDWSDQVNLHKWIELQDFRLLTQIFVHLQQGQCMSFFRKGSQTAAAYSRWGLMNATYNLSRVSAEEYLQNRL